MSDFKGQKVLLITSSMHGQANCFLAVAHSLMQRGVNVHFCSHDDFAESARKASEYSLQAFPDAKPMTFHPIRTVSGESSLLDSPAADNLNMEPGPFYPMRCMRAVRWIIANVLSSDRFMELYWDCVEVIKKVNPDIIAVDLVFGSALSATAHSGHKWLILAPNSAKDFSIAYQPPLRNLCSFPCFGTGFEYPVPFWKVPMNIAYKFMVVGAAMLYRGMDPKLKPRMKQESGKELVVPTDVAAKRPAGVQVLISSLPEMDFTPLRIAPDIVSCGPILQPIVGVADTDPALAEWLARGPTVLVNLGTLFVWKQTHVVQMARALKRAYDEVRAKDPKLRDLQILWKIKLPNKAKPSKDTCPAFDILEDEIAKDKVRIETWLTANPVSIMQSGHIVLSVNHGAANLWNEAVVTGTPQVNLPTWFDCFDYAARSEFLGIGLHGSYKHQPEWAAEELGPVIVRALVGLDAQRIRARSRDLATLCAQSEKGPGRDYAADYIMGQIDA
ncbi:hypothetical protein BX600DRAFT_500138 [Xylariales sp. PMI_506]|nr:hypothetical protein BX600DRAFT_500138 [Xylariales sp. PMI_506]